MMRFLIFVFFLSACAHSSQADILHTLDKASDAQVQNWLKSISDSCGVCKPIVSHDEDADHVIQAMVLFQNKDLHTQFQKRGIQATLQQCGQEIRTVFTYQGVSYCLTSHPTQERVFEPKKYNPSSHHISPSTTAEPQGELTQGNHYYLLTIVDPIIIGRCFGPDMYLTRYESRFILEDELSKIPYLVSLDSTK